ncbi:pfkB family carbohydrate kinase [Pseudomassariella vexata]|uniref:adenosine kinase n=1 Tax=Pseudomassariella vexata TaxID=1141098 RepID=A0A1Y2EF81_9PEZI|nr:pfkB family carbohydrate kinase [Pseudomassariella vexata]ORY69926.1 pfkB family carbohydrate kinase [Pseudomassariella vexata]
MSNLTQLCDVALRAIRPFGFCRSFTSRILTTPPTLTPPSASSLFKFSAPRYFNYSTTASRLPKSLFTMASSNEYSLLCLENPLLDIQAVGDKALLDKYGLKDNDAILAEETHMGLYEDLLNNYDAKLIAGGAAQNTARGAQYILPANSVVYLGGVGDDKYAAILQDAVKQAGLRVEYRVDPKVPTGKCGVIITGHNRSLCTDLGAANHYDLEHLKRDDIWALVKSAQYYYVGGYHFTVCPPAIMALGEEAAANNKTFVVNVSAPFIAEFFKDPLDASSPFWDVVICNETEAGAYAKSHGLASETDITAIAKHLANLPKKNSQRPRTAVITQGTEPTIVAVQGQDDVKQFPVHAISKDQINDTNGAGDAFAGGFVAGLVQGKSLEESVDMGQWLARLSIQELGPSYPFPKQTYTASN